MNFECPLCHTQSKVPDDNVGQFIPCPACGQTVAVDSPLPMMHRGSITSQRVAFQVFSSGLATWEELFQEAADFATQVGPDNLITVSHSEDGNDGVVTVWYWTE